MRRRARWLILAAVVVLVAALTPVAWRVGEGLVEPGAERAVPIESANLSGSGPGSLVSAMTMPGFAHTNEGKGMHSARVVYRSTSGDTGAPTEVSGSVFAPLGAPPPGGWPVIVFAHGTTGINEPCAPSLSATLLNMTGPVIAFIRNGYAVAMPDYQGLGADGVHPYPDSRTAGLNLIDSVRALRHTFADVSKRWAAVGGSQGGGAVWAADEQAAAYAPELELVGAVAYVPAADVTGLVDKALNNTLTDDQRLIWIAVVESLARLHPDVNRDDYRRGAAAKYWDVLTSCSGPMVSDRPAAIEELQAGDLTPASPEAADKIRRLLAAWALPQRPLSAPLSVVYGGRDTFIDADWTTAAIGRACALGGTVASRLEPGKGHGGVDVTDQYAWLQDRFAGKPVSSGCAPA
ncbi:lipase family protein [Mycobacterium deserti]|uniref:Lipase family protein n=1 Tax=Mycobacterium deserti TaxID=2978347 RepID=A0ABT2MF42_9MYCO|nr:lipase family protein [Mycobacterium deserti]MCT7660899.1 lipase family protein [Mycobacterium deserti]